MKDEAYILKRFERVEELGRKVLSSVCVGGFGHRYVEMTLFAKWKTECVTLLGSVMPNSAIYAGQDIEQTGYAVDATYTTSCAPPPMMEDLGLGSVAIARPASL